MIYYITACKYIYSYSVILVLFLEIEMHAWEITDGGEGFVIYRPRWIFRVHVNARCERAHTFPRDASRGACSIYCAWNYEPGVPREESSIRREWTQEARTQHCERRLPRLETLERPRLSLLLDGFTVTSASPSRSRAKRLASKTHIGHN